MLGGQPLEAQFIPVMEDLKIAQNICCSKTNKETHSPSIKTVVQEKPAPPDGNIPEDTSITLSFLGEVHFPKHHI